MTRNLLVSSIVAPIFILRGKTFLDKKSFNEDANLQLRTQQHLLSHWVIGGQYDRRYSVAVKYILSGKC